MEKMTVLPLFLTWIEVSLERHPMMELEKNSEEDINDQISNQSIALIDFITQSFPCA